MSQGDDRRRADPFRWLLDVGAALAGGTDSRDSLQDMAAAIGLAMNVSQVDIQSLDRERGIVVQEAVWERDGLSEEHLSYIGTEIPLEDLGLDRVVYRREMDETRIDDPGLSDGERGGFERWGYKSTLDAPLVIGDEVIGVLGVTEKRYVRRFMTAERERFEQLAALTAAALRNLRIAAHERSRSARLEVLLALGEALADGDAERAARVAADGGIGQLGATRAAVWEVGAGTAPALRAGADEPGADDWLPHVEERRGADPFHLAEAAALELGDPLRLALRRRGEAAWLLVPIAFLGRGLGWLVLAWRERAPASDDDDLAFAIALAEQLATGFENERLIAESGLGAASAPRSPDDPEALLESEKEV